MNYTVYSSLSFALILYSVGVSPAVSAQSEVSIHRQVVSVTESIRFEGLNCGPGIGSTDVYAIASALYNSNLTPSPGLSACYSSLGLEAKTQVAFSLAEIHETDGLDKTPSNLRATWDQIAISEANARNGEPAAARLDILSSTWGWGVRPYKPIGYFRGNPDDYYTSQYECDSSDADIDYVFFFWSNYSDDEDLGCNSSSHILVDAMVLYYHGKYGGLNSKGDSEGTWVKACVGNTGIEMAGLNNIMNHLDLREW